VAETRWANFEDQVRDIASRIFGKRCRRERIAGVDFDGFIEESSDRVTLVEATTQFNLDKVRGDINRLTAARNVLWQKGKYCRPFLILQRDPTQSMTDLCDESHVKVMSVSSFAALFIEYERYRLERLSYPFGSSVNPSDGRPDQTRYVPVSYINKVSGRDYTVRAIADALISGSDIVLLGEYGSGKSRCIRQVYELLSAEWGATFQFPFAVNLRDSWGLRRGEEILRRHMNALGLDELKAQAVKVFNRGSALLLLDGFDEIGIQAWATDDAKLAQLRASALEGVKELIIESNLGTLVAGREHYFSSRDEMISALGLREKETIVLYAKEEFTADELRLYFQEANIDVTFPEWLPRRPLICQTIASLAVAEIDAMFGRSADEALFWDHFILTLCERDAKIHPAFTAEAIFGILLELSRLTRTRAANVGPVSQKDLQDAFEAVVGQRPVEEGSALLQRLPSLGRIGTESPDRQFVDFYILDGLRGSHAARILELDETRRSQVLEESWTNPLGPLGQTVLLPALEGRWSQYEQILGRATQSKNKTLAADLASAMLRSSRNSVDFRAALIRDGAFSELDFSISQSKNLTIESCTIETLVLPFSPPDNTSLKDCLVNKVVGASALSGLPAWISLAGADEFDSVRTVSRIRNAKLSTAHEVLVGIIKKTFFQPGSGRKEEALLRGFGSGQGQKVAPKILNILLREKILSKFKGNEGWVYSPERSQAGRMGEMLEKLRSSTDPLWSEVGEI
jgi:hypothetical protein